MRECNKSSAVMELHMGLYDEAHVWPAHSDWPCVIPTKQSVRHNPQAGGLQADCFVWIFTTV